ncbi:MAG TPA: MmgE/PrpD family protein [Stellaceae bacterium]|nr:MmgE/PrpD family protein [Stellaceae bacterium]
MERAPLTRALGDFASRLSFAALPPRAVDVVRLGFTDCIAAMLAGIDEPVSRLIREELDTRGLSGEARLTLGAERASARDAALANAVAAHALDYDDVALAGHPSVVLVPAIFAEAEALAADGSAAVTAYVAGYETWAALIGRDPDPYHQKGWHPTATLGAIAAAAAIANLRRLDPEKSMMAIAISASMAAGVVANFGTMTKPFQAGRAAQAGIIAARLAAAGMTASRDALEHPTGVLAALSPRGRVDLVTPGEALGQQWRIVETGLNVKQYPMCYSAHRALDGILELKRQHRLTAEEVKKIVVTTGETQAAMLRNHRPRTGLEAKFSMEFAMAAALVAGRAGLNELTDRFVCRREVKAAMEKVEIATTDSKAEDDPTFARFDRVAVTLTDGRMVVSPELRFARGHWSLPLHADELWAKFRDCAASRFEESGTRLIFEQLQSLERQANLREIGAS